MSNHDIIDVYDILTVGTETIPPKEIYYAKLGKLICAMHNEANVTLQQIQRRNPATDTTCHGHNTRCITGLRTGSS